MSGPAVATPLSLSLEGLAGFVPLKAASGVGGGGYECVGMQGAGIQARDFKFAPSSKNLRISDAP